MVWRMHIVACIECVIQIGTFILYVNFLVCGAFFYTRFYVCLCVGVFGLMFECWLCGCVVACMWIYLDVYFSDSCTFAHF